MRPQIQPLTIAIIVLSVTACASPKSTRDEHTNQFDTDGDGSLSREEYSASALSATVRFDALDTNGDELLSASELEFQMGAVRKERRDRAEKGGRRRN
ncbi:MAG: hypothetical protein K0U72_03700 [Gammaproteobacteria bacterium]|nr:hypothetical protein [Gammaproteobacteria bacterium]